VGDDLVGADGAARANRLTLPDQPREGRQRAKTLSRRVIVGQHDNVDERGRVHQTLQTCVEIARVSHVKEAAQTFGVVAPAVSNALGRVKRATRLGNAVRAFYWLLLLVVVAVVAGRRLFVVHRWLFVVIVCGVAELKPWLERDEVALWLDLGREDNVLLSQPLEVVGERLSHLTELDLGQRVLLRLDRELGVQVQLALFRTLVQVGEQTTLNCPLSHSVRQSKSDSKMG